MEDRVEQLRAIAKIVKHACGEGIGFALFLQAGGETSYLSTGNRADVVKALDEWLVRVRSVGGKGRSETSQQVDSRLALERKCAEIGKVIAQVAPVAIFLFDFGDGGSMAYFTNIERADVGVEAWVRHEQGRS